jgi:hypothetical protein
VTEEAILDVLGLERFAEERIVLKVEHAEDEVIAGTPEGVGFLQLFGAEWTALHGGSRFAERAEGCGSLGFDHWSRCHGAPRGSIKE